MNLADLSSAGEEMYEALGREHYLTGAGLKEDPAFSEIFARFDALMDDEVLGLVRSSGSRELLEWLIDFRIGRRAAELDEQMFRWEQSTTLEVGGGQVEYLRAPIELANSENRSYRITLDAARSRANADGLDELKRKRFTIEHEEMACLGGNYVDSLSELSGIDLMELGRCATDFLDSTADLYTDCMRTFTRHRLGLEISELLRADSAWAFRGEGYDRFFPPERMIETAVRQMTEMGLDAMQDGRVRFDTEERAGKQSRAFCAPVRVPEEVYLVLRPQGGRGDYHTFWHELGHAMHFASPSRDLPFAARWLGDNSVTEGFAMLWDHMTMNPRWIGTYTDLGPGEVRDLVFELGVHDLFMVRRYAAKLVYELSLHSGNLEGLGPEYAAILSDATLFRFSELDHMSDVDPGFYCARYLRAWQFEAVVASLLVNRFDTDWFRNPKAGAFLHTMMSKGQSLKAHDLVASVGQRSLSFKALIQRFESMLA